MADYTLGLPYDGWYNGSIKLMIQQGTYADFRDKIVERVDQGFYDHYKVEDGKPVTREGEKILAQADKAWEEIPVEKRIEARNAVVDYSTPKDVQIVTSKGVIITKKAKPSGDDYSVKSVKKQRRTRRTQTPKGKARGALTKENNPIKAKPVSPTE